MPTEKINKRFDENFLKSPVPFLIGLKKITLGKNSPSIIFRICFYINFITSIIYIFWHLIAFISIYFRKHIFDQNNIDVDSIILTQAKIFGFQSADFIKNLELFHLLSIFCWSVILFSGVFLWRRIRGYFLIYVLAFIAYILIDILVFLSGERSAFFNLIMSTLIILILIKKWKIMRLVAFVISTFLITVIIFVNNSVRDRMVNLTIDQFNFAGDKLNIFSEIHSAIYLSAFKMFKEK